MVYDCPEPFIGRYECLSYDRHSNVYHSQSKPVGSRAKTSFLVMREFNAESCYFFKINLHSKLLGTLPKAASKGYASAVILDP